MTKEERLKILSEAEERAYIALSNAEMGAEATTALLEQLSTICFLQDREGIWDVESCCGECGKHENSTEPAEVVETEPVVEEEPTSAPVEPAVHILPAENETPTKQEVLAVLTPISNSHPDDLIPSVMKSMGFEKLSEIPASRYQELLDKVRAAVEDK